MTPICCGLTSGREAKHVDRAAHVLDSLGQGLGKELRIGRQGPRTARRTPLRVVGQFEPDRRDSPCGQGRALQSRQLKTAAQDVQANHRRPRR